MGLRVNIPTLAKREALMLPDKQFIQEFEQAILDPVHFNHLGHVRIAWLYLHENNTEQAIQKLAIGIKRYATALGAPEKFHMTMTQALVYLIEERLKDQTSLTWQEFTQANPELLSDAKALVAEYYSEAIIESETARINFVPPDKKPF